MNINLHIERLVLDGLPVERGHEPLLRAALEAELTRLLSATTGGLSVEGSLARVHAPAIGASEGGDAAGLGREIARSVYDSLGGRR